MQRSVKKIGVLILALVMMMLGGCSSLQSKSSEAIAEKYPTKPITVIVPFAAGGMTDIIARGMEKASVKYFEQPFIVVNKPGGAGTIAWNELAGAKPSGYVIGMVTLGSVLQPIYGQSKYNYPTALEPIAQIANPPIVMSISPNSKYKTVADLVRYAKDHPGEIKFGHTGIGSSLQVLAEMFAQAADIKMEQVPFQGSSEEIAALLGGHIDVIFSGATELREHVKSNKIKVVAIAGSHRINDADFSDVPTFKEQGFDAQISNWQCIAVPKEMPPNIKSKLSEGIRNIINDPDFNKNMKQLGIEVEYLGPEECTKTWAHDYEQLGKIVRITGIAERIAAQRN